MLGKIMKIAMKYAGKLNEKLQWNIIKIAMRYAGKGNENSNEMYWEI
jgi:hypothetical protein